MHQAGMSAVLFLASVLIAGWLVESRRRAEKARRRTANVVPFRCAAGTAQRELLDVNQVIDEMIGRLRAEAARHSISLHSDLASHLPAVVAERVQLQQVLTSLMLSAIQAMENAAQPNDLCIRSRREGDTEVRVSISDTGVALPRDSSDVSTSVNAPAQGSGMGLRMSRSILESQGGRLWATANADRGATFHFTLPASSAE